MNRPEFEQYIAETYSADPEHPWARYPENTVFRHGNNQKWFALIMDVPGEKLGLRDPGLLSVANLKCSPLLIGSFLSMKGFFPAYHMSKSNWISVALDGSVPTEQLRMLLDLSFDLTAGSGKTPTSR